MSDAEFSQVVGEMGFQEAVLLDRHGCVLQVWPRNPDLLGTNLVGSAHHLNQALGGRVGVGQRLGRNGRRLWLSRFPSQARKGEECSAAPLQSAGRRSRPISITLFRTRTASSQSSTLPDPSWLRTGPKALRNPRWRAPIPHSPGHSEARATGRTSVAARSVITPRHPIDGTPWQLVASVSLDLLLAPISGETAVVPWILFAAFAAAVGTLLALLVRLGQEVGAWRSPTSRSPAATAPSPTPTTAPRSRPVEGRIRCARLT